MGMKNKSIQYSLLSFTLAFALLFAGCEATEDPQNTDHGKMCNFQFCLKLPESISVKTKADPPITPTIGDDKININNVWILQYDVSGNLIRSVYKEDDINNDTDFVQENLYMVRINTDTNSDEEKFSDMSSHFYIIVNGEKSLLEGFTGTEADLKAKTVNFYRSTWFKTYVINIRAL